MVIEEMIIKKNMPIEKMLKQLGVPADDIATFEQMHRDEIQDIENANQIEKFMQMQNRRESKQSTRDVFPIDGEELRQLAE